MLPLCYSEPLRLQAAVELQLYTDVPLLHLRVLRDCGCLHVCASVCESVCTSDALVS